ncbi:hydroperoxide isomerase ALOXE3-like [Pimephales promelas]|uniref:hydroperoxide isomerase ALOXE3-like n=1 Tax=Pimephales promelas TaxID=90988 RepID=UPI001955B860|nr:hydroperoxide isomerase ALOXE3-like [Pimephales promelas]
MEDKNSDSDSQTEERTAMVIYTVKAYTGTRLLAGTTSRIFIQLRGTEAESEEQNLNHFEGFWQGSEREFKMHCKVSLGELIAVKLFSKPFMGLLHNRWFCDKISINTPEGDKILFPCYCWLDCNEKLVLRPAKASFVFQDTNPIAQRQRMRQLEEQQNLFRWRVYAEGTPQVIDCDTALTLPPEVQFSFTKEIEFYSSAGKQLAALKLTGWADSKRSWESISQLKKILCGKQVKTIEYCQEHWDEDEFFGYQFLNGLNPMMIQLCSTLPENFPVTDDMVKGSLGGSSLEQEMEKGNIFLSDYKMLDELVGNVISGRQQYLTAPLVLLYCNPQGMMLPIAIQLRQKPTKDNPIFLPTDSKADWKLAKIFVRNAEFGVHEVDFHLLRTHLLAEVFTVATLRNLPSPHPLYKLLFPHMRYTLQINIMARNQLISKDGAISMYAGVGGESLEKLLKRATASLTYSALCLPDNISERGLETVPNYYYRDDGMKLWDIINKFVAAFLAHYYKHDTHVQKDMELQRWIREIFTNGFLGRDSSGIPSSVQTLKELIKFVTMVIFTASAQHAAVNSGQFDFGGWMPNYPTALRKPPPKEKSKTAEDTILETLPDVSTTVNGMAVLRLLSKDSADHYPLGNFPEHLYDEEVPCKLIEDFKKDLEKLSDLIEERNKKLELPYTYLNPKNVDNSVAI